MISLLNDQVKANLKQFVREPVAVFFTIILPLVMLLIFASIFGGEENYTTTPAGRFPLTQFYVGGLAAFSVVSATFTNLASTIPERRQNGVMRRWRGAPLPPWVYPAGLIVMAALLALISVVVMVAVGVALFDTEIEAGKLPSMVLTFLVGTTAFSILGAAVSGLVRSQQAAPAVANAIILPLAFLSNIFIPLDDAPGWLETVGQIFPLRPFGEAMQNAFNPLVEAPAFEWGSVAIVAAWGVGGAVVAARTFKWDPVADQSPRRQHAQT